MKITKMTKMTAARAARFGRVVLVAAAISAATMPMVAHASIEQDIGNEATLWLDASDISEAIHKLVFGIS